MLMCVICVHAPTFRAEAGLQTLEPAPGRAFVAGESPRLPSHAWNFARADGSSSAAYSVTSSDVLVTSWSYRSKDAATGLLFIFTN